MATLRLCRKLQPQVLRIRKRPSWTTVPESPTGAKRMTRLGTLWPVILSKSDTNWSRTMASPSLSVDSLDIRHKQCPSETGQRPYPPRAPRPHGDHPHLVPHRRGEDNPGSGVSPFPHTIYRGMYLGGWDWFAPFPVGILPGSGEWGSWGGLTVGSVGTGLPMGLAWRWGPCM